MKLPTLNPCSPLMLLALLASLGPTAHAATPAELLAVYNAQARVAASPARGEKLFTTNFGKELGLSCASCHGAQPTQPGKHAISEKPIDPLAPAANPKRFTDRARVDGAFSTNCKDVLGRECSAGEKADVLSWLLTLKP
jgi:mono/diheme cytochrome c family protein